MDADKSILEKFADTIKAAADAIVHPTAGTPMKMPLNESGYAITHLERVAKAKVKAPAKKAVKQSGRKPPKAAKKLARKSTAKQRAGKTAGSKSARKAPAKKKAGKSRR
jgi:hypothetical protein